MGRKKKIVLPDRIFHKLWDAAVMTKDFDLYFKLVSNTSSKYYIDFNRFGFDIELKYETLSMIHEIANKSMSQIFIESNLTKAAFSHRFCIPIRTVEDWIAERRKCPPYVKLLILESFGTILLPKQVCIESRANISNNKTSVNKNMDTNVANIIEEILNEDNDDEFYNELENISSNFSIKEWEQTHLASHEQILDKTDYLSSIIHRKDK